MLCSVTKAQTLPHILPGRVERVAKIQVKRHYLFNERKQMEPAACSGESITGWVMTATVEPVLSRPLLRPG